MIVILFQSNKYIKIPTKFKTIFLRGWGVQGYTLFLKGVYDSEKVKNHLPKKVIS